MKIVSWNVNGIRACLKKGFYDFFNDVDADIFCIQETKANQEQVVLELDGYYQFWNSAFKKGYSGTLILSKKEPLSTKYGIGIEEHDNEGRVITLEFDNFYLVNCYTPNSKRGLLRLEYRMEWDKEFRKYLESLNNKELIVCGDLNVAHTNLDLTNPKSNKNNPGFTDMERNNFSDLLKINLVDIYREFNPNKVGAYTWWSYIANARERNIGWRIDFFLVSRSLKNRVKEASIYRDILGSDHCPIGLIIE